MTNFVSLAVAVSIHFTAMLVLAPRLPHALCTTNLQSIIKVERQPIFFGLTELRSVRKYACWPAKFAEYSCWKGHIAFSYFLIFM